MREVSMLITKDAVPLLTTMGHETMVHFPALMPTGIAWELHQHMPGIIWKMVHTHPEGACYLSHEDRGTLLAWTYAFSPYPVNMEVICPFTNDKGKEEIYREMFWFELQTLADWIEHGRKGARTIKLKSKRLPVKGVKWIRPLMKLSYGMMNIPGLEKIHKGYGNNE